MVKQTNIISRFIIWLINSSIFISFGAVAITIGTQIQLGKHPQWHPYLFLIFFATLFEYNLHRLIAVRKNKESLISDNHRWVKHHVKLFYALVFISIIGFWITVLLAKQQVLLTLLPVAFITLFYSTPISKKAEATMKLRQLPFLKIFLISFVWSAATVLLPMIESEKSFDYLSVFSILIERFLFIFAITIPFDIRDMETDESSGLKTLPLLMGKKKSIVLAAIVLFVFLLICFIHYYLTNQLFIFLALTISCLSTLFFINNEHVKKSPFYYYGILDGTIFLQGLLLLIFYQFKDYF